MYLFSAQNILISLHVWKLTKSGPFFFFFSYETYHYTLETMENTLLLNHTPLDFSEKPSVFQLTMFQLTN